MYTYRERDRDREGRVIYTHTHATYLRTPIHTCYSYTHSRATHMFVCMCVCAPCFQPDHLAHNLPWERQREWGRAGREVNVLDFSRPHLKKAHQLLVRGRRSGGGERRGREKSTIVRVGREKEHAEEEEEV
jgi:hypothetical protein